MLSWAPIATGSLLVEQEISLHVSRKIRVHQRAKSRNIDDSGHFRIFSVFFFCCFIHCYASFVLFTLMVWTVLFSRSGGYNQKRRVFVCRYEEFME